MKKPQLIALSIGIEPDLPIANMETGYCHMEKMAGFNALPMSFGFKVCCFPVKIKNASAGWVRPVALV